MLFCAISGFKRHPLYIIFGWFLSSTLRNRSEPARLTGPEPYWVFGRFGPYYIGRSDQDQSEVKIPYSCIIFTRNVSVIDSKSEYLIQQAVEV